jgi:hypothetical protein
VGTESGGVGQHNKMTDSSSMRLSKLGKHLACNFLTVLTYEDWWCRRPVEKAAPWLTRKRNVTKQKKGGEIGGAEE